MKYTRNILLALTLLFILTGCKNTMFGSLFNNFFTMDKSNDFVLDNDSTFDLFQDDFGTGTQYDDRFVDSGNGNLDVGDTDISANGQIDYGSEPSLTIDLEYNRIGNMTPNELHPQEAIDIPVLILGSNFFPFPDKQFGDKKPEDKCNHAHYHGTSGYTLDLQNISEPDSPCGFDNATKIMSVTGDEMIDWFHNRPRNF